MKASPLVPLVALLGCAPKHSLEEKVLPQANPAVVVPEFIVKHVDEQYRGNGVYVSYTEDRNGCIVEKRIEGNTGSAFQVGNDFTVIYTYFDCSKYPVSMEHIDYSPTWPGDIAISEPFIRDPTDIVLEQYKETYQRDQEGCLTRVQVLSGDHMTYQIKDDGRREYAYSAAIVYDAIQYFLIARPEGVFKEVIGEIDSQSVITGGIIITFNDYTASDCTVLEYRPERVKEIPFTYEHIVNEDIIKDGYLKFKGDGKRHDNPHGKYTLTTLSELIQPETNISVEAP